MKESPEDIAVSPKPRMIPVEYARAKDIADGAAPGLCRSTWWCAGQDQQGRRRVAGSLPMLMGGMGWWAAGGPAAAAPAAVVGGGGGSGGQNQRDPANRISIGVDTRTNNLVIAAADPLFEEVKQLVQELDMAAAEQNETVRVVTPASHQRGSRREGPGGLCRRRRANHELRLPAPLTTTITITATQILQRRRGPPEEVSAACGGGFGRTTGDGRRRAIRRQFALLPRPGRFLRPRRARLQQPCAPGSSDNKKNREIHEKEVKTGRFMTRRWIHFHFFIFLSFPTFSPRAARP